MNVYEAIKYMVDHPGVALWAGLGNFPRRFNPTLFTFEIFYEGNWGAPNDRLRGFPCNATWKLYQESPPDPLSDSIKSFGCHAERVKKFVEVLDQRYERIKK